MISFKNSITKIKINRIGDNFWFQPSIWTVSKRKYAARPYKTFKRMMKNESLLNQNFMFTLNSDDDLEVFRWCQELNKINFFLNKEQKEQVSIQGYVEYKIPKTNISLRFDKKSLKALKWGFIPFFSIEWLKSNFRSKDKITLVWRKKGYIETT